MSTETPENQENFEEFSAYMDTPEMQAHIRTERASLLTSADILAEVAGWGSVSEAVVLDFVALLSLRPGKDGLKLFETLRLAVPTDELRELIEGEWVRLRGEGAGKRDRKSSDWSNEGRANRKLEFDDEDELVDAIHDEGWALVHIGGKVLFIRKDDAGLPVMYDKHNAHLALAQYRYFVVTKKSTIEQSGFDVWLKSPRRREYAGAGCYPPPLVCPVGHFNLWTGFAFQPVPGDCSLFYEHLRNNICRGDEAQYNFLLDWCSQLLNEPGVKSGVIAAVLGEHGTGKSKLGEWLYHIIGKRHGLVVEKKELITGRFNGHLEGKVFIQSEEAVFSGDAKAADVLKHLATAQSVTYESKGLDAREGNSFVRVYMTSNKDHIALVESGDRRFFVQNCGADHKEDKSYFAALDKQMWEGGASAFLHDMVQRGVTFASLGKIPMTSAKQEQLQHSMPAPMQWLATALTDGIFPGPDGEVWPLSGGAVTKSSVVASYQSLVHGFRSPPTPVMVGIFMTKYVPNLGTVKRALYQGGLRLAHYVLPPLEEARAAFLIANPGYVFDMDRLEDAAASPANDTEPLRRAN